MQKFPLITCTALIFLVLAVSGCLGQSPQSSKMDDFAKCLSDSGAAFYGAYWCQHCSNQKQMFGESLEFVNYIECSLPNRAGQTRACMDAGIKGYPTWEFGDGSRASGEQTFEELGQKSGCLLS